MSAEFGHFDVGVVYNKPYDIRAGVGKLSVYCSSIHVAVHHAVTERRRVGRCSVNLLVDVRGVGRNAYRMPVAVVIGYGEGKRDIRHDIQTVIRAGCLTLHGYGRFYIACRRDFQRELHIVHAVRVVVQPHAQGVIAHVLCAVNRRAVRKQFDYEIVAYQFGSIIPVHGQLYLTVGGCNRTLQRARGIGQLVRNDGQERLQERRGKVGSVEFPAVYSVRIGEQRFFACGKRVVRFDEHRRADGHVDVQRRQV